MHQVWCQWPGLWALPAGCDQAVSTMMCLLPRDLEVESDGIQHSGNIPPSHQS